MSKQQYFWPIAKIFYNMSMTCHMSHVVSASLKDVEDNIAQLVFETIATGVLKGITLACDDIL